MTWIPTISQDPFQENPKPSLNANNKKHLQTASSHRVECLVLKNHPNHHLEPQCNACLLYGWPSKNRGGKTQQIIHLFIGFFHLFLVQHPYIRSWFKFFVPSQIRCPKKESKDFDGKEWNDSILLLLPLSPFQPLTIH